MQKAALAYASDFQFLSTVPKALHNSPNIKMMASLDHCMWFYNEFRVDEWLLFVMEQLRCQHMVQLEGLGYRGFIQQVCSRRLILLKFLKNID